MVAVSRNLLGFPLLFEGYVELFGEIVPILKQPWIDDAACAEVDPSLWYPGQGHEDDMVKARQICGVCAVSNDCREWAVDHDELGGIWAGLSQAERRRAVA